jgi:hypothetical protein
MRIGGEREVLELAEDNREAARKEETQCPSSSHMSSRRPKGGITTPTTRRVGAREGAARCGGNDPRDQPPLENHERMLFE